MCGLARYEQVNETRLNQSQKEKGRRVKEQTLKTVEVIVGADGVGKGLVIIIEAIEVKLGLSEVALNFRMILSRV